MADIDITGRSAARVRAGTMDGVRRRTAIFLAVSAMVLVDVAAFAPSAMACSCVAIGDPAFGPVTSFDGHLVRRDGDRLTFAVERRLSALPRSTDRVVVQTMSGDEAGCGRSWSAFRRYRVVATGTDVLHSNFCHPTETLGFAIPASFWALTPAGRTGTVLVVIATLLVLAGVAVRQRRNRPVWRLRGVTRWK